MAFRSGAAAVLGALILAAAAEGAGIPETPESKGSTRNAATRERLNQELGAVITTIGAGNPADTAEFSAIMARWATVTKLEVIPDWMAIEGAGAARNTQISVELREMTAEHALKIMLSEGGDGKVTLAFCIDNGVIRISTQEAINKKVTPRPATTSRPGTGPARRPAR